MTATFSMTARDMVTQAMREIGVIASGEDPTADEMADGLLRLNSMLKSWAAKGLNLWRDTDATILFPAGTATLALPGALSVDNVRLRTAGYDRPLARWEIDDFRSIPNKTAAGAPTVYAISTAPQGLSMSLWPVPATEALIAYSYGRATETAEASAPLDLPQMFQEAVWMNLAVRLAPTFGKARADPATVQMVAARAAELERDMLDWDRPESYHLGPDLDGYP